MNKETPHKFQEKMEISYEQYFKAITQSAVELVNAFEHTLGRDRTFEIVRKWTQKSAADSVKKQMSEKPVKNFEDFKRLTKKQEGTPIWTHMLTLTHPEETPTKFCYNITECLWAKTFKELNAADLGYILCCEPDFAKAGAYHPKISLERTKTLMQGASYCNHMYYWKE